jgi:hypothetical protein
LLATMGAICVAVVACCRHDVPEASSGQIVEMRHPQAVVHFTIHSTPPITVRARVADNYRLLPSISKMNTSPAPVNSNGIRVAWELAGPTRHGDVYTLAITDSSQGQKPYVTSAIYEGTRLQIVSNELVSVYIANE